MYNYCILPVMYSQTGTIILYGIVLIKYYTVLLKLQKMFKDSILRVELLKMMLPKN